MHFLQKEFMVKYMCWYAHGKLYVPHDTMIEWMVGSISCSSNVYIVVNDNNNSYRYMILDVMRMNQIHTRQCLIIDKEPNMPWL